MTRRVMLAMALAMAIGLTASSETAAQKRDPRTGEMAIAELRTAEGASVGRVTFVQTPNGVLVRGHLRNLPPGTRAIHVHETGKCEGPSFESAGKHFSAAGHQHGFKTPQGPHAGDLPNVHVAQDGEARFETLAPGLTIAGSHHAGLLGDDGTAVIVHEQADDYQSQPSGAAGGRIACGVVVTTPAR